MTANAAIYGKHNNFDTKSRKQTKILCWRVVVGQIKGNKNHPVNEGTLHCYMELLGILATIQA